jgi:hypothetical protein
LLVITHPTSQRHAFYLLHASQEIPVLRSRDKRSSAIVASALQWQRFLQSQISSDIGRFPHELPIV